MELYKTIPERLRLIAVLKCELSLAIEGRFTNLRIWQSGDSVYMRLDKANNYSAPLNEQSAKYIRSNKITDQLLKYGFESPATNLTDILEITKDMPYRMCIEW